MTGPITAVTMPKWGLAMEEGMVVAWHAAEGAAVTAGDDLVDIETTKITNVLESPAAGTLRRRLAAEGETLPVGALLGVVAATEVPEAELDAFVARFQDSFAADTAAAAEAAGPQVETVEIDGRAIAYQVLGDGDAPPLVLVHGFGGDRNTWMFNQPVLAATRRTVALDLPGHGLSAKDVGDGSIDVLRDAVAGLLDALDIGRAYLVGHSLGGAIAVQLALQRPERVAGLSLICPAGLGAEVNRDYIDGFIAASRRKALKEVLGVLFADPDLVSRDMIEEVQRYKRLDGVDAALRRLADGLFADGRQATVLRDRLGEISVPVQVIWGAADAVVPPAHAEGLPDSVAAHVLDGAGHMPHMEKAGEVNRLIAEALAAQS
jgi:pyruvate dehydrogenase E2 component (dihydrolipoamide acetyltransferase)